MDSRHSGEIRTAPQPSAQRPAAQPEQEKEDEKPQAPSDEAADEEFTPTEELQPDAAVTFPVDI